MNLTKTDIVKKYAHDDEEKLILARALDKLEECEQRNILTHTRFLNEQQRLTAQKMLLSMDNPRHLFWGGYERAERSVLIFLPDYLEQEQIMCGDYDPLMYLRASYPPANILSHRDILGSLMGCGVKRDTVGDILVGDGHSDVVVLKEVESYISQTFESAGRVRLQTELITAEKLYVPEEKYILLRDTVASLRFDNIVAAGFGLSRTKAAENIESGRAALNRLENTHTDKMVGAGDIITVRGQGKITLFEVGNTTKKGRVGIVIKKWV
ncbi:YlmH/Sll1252 family protein [Dehalobacter sp. DCM]|uniref:YlmH family RNA-binding protein n=1 Tax=Dehalobacter sp. DCM TaxID=2907827 RepID=UPI003081F159|nr:YlmH/Sll1252 family protein [Dehalobacter sp. DCM]